MIQRISRAKLALVVILFFTAGAAATADEPICGHYVNSMATYFPGYGWACAGSGATCRECTMFGGGGGYTVCIQQSGDLLICTDYQY